MHQGIIPLEAAILSAGTVVGGKEQEGPLGPCFDFCNPHDRFGQTTWEKAESEMQRMALAAALKKSHLTPDSVDALFAGDLLNQCVGSAYGLLPYDIPYFGLYGACSTSVEGLLLAASLISGQRIQTAAVVTSSHNASAERQFRSPLEYGGQRPPTGQWTVTGAGAFILSSIPVPATPAVSAHSPVSTVSPVSAVPSPSPASAVPPSPTPPTDTPAPIAYLTAGLGGIVLDRGISDVNQMGAAMAPAAESTLTRFFRESHTTPADYDAIVTGDLGHAGGAILCDLLRGDGYDITARYHDCGRMIFASDRQDTHCGGSGCGCAATVLGGYWLPRLQNGTTRRMLFLATGAMMSPDSIKQGQSIPAIAHLIRLESPKNFPPSAQ